MLKSAPNCQKIPPKPSVCDQAVAAGFTIRSIENAPANEDVSLRGARIKVSSRQVRQANKSA